MKVIGVQTKDIVFSRQHVQDVIEKVRAKGPGCPPFNEVFDALKKNEMQMMLVIDEMTIVATIITEFANDGDDKILRIVSLAGGRMNEWLEDAMFHVEQYALRENCSHMELIGRKGWQKIFKQNGFQTESVIMRRSIS